MQDGSSKDEPITISGGFGLEPAGLSPGRSSTIRDGVYDAIIEHRLPPGTKLSEIKVGAAFDVSRTVARAALQALAHEGVVTMVRNRGAFVARPDAVEAGQVFAARRLIEPEISREAAQHCTPRATASLAAHLTAEETAVRGHDRRTAIRLSGLFHLRIASIAGNAVLGRFLRELVARSSLIIALFGRSGASACGAAEHCTIMDALARGDGTAAAEAMLSHLDHIERDLNLGRGPGERVDLVEVLRTPRKG